MVVFVGFEDANTFSPGERGFINELEAFTSKYDFEGSLLLFGCGVDASLNTAARDVLDDADFKDLPRRSYIDLALWALEFALEVDKRDSVSSLLNVVDRRTSRCGFAVGGPRMKALGGV